MRRAYIGLSGPLAYDYKRAATNRTAPNPILEDSLGLLILYDELVFLSPALCPKNMRKLPYVKFLTDRNDFGDVMTRVLDRAKATYAINDSRDSKFEDPYTLYEPALVTVIGQPYRVDRDTARYIPDNHSQQISMGPGLSAAGSSTWFQNVIADWIAVVEFDVEDCEIVSNSGNQVFYAAMETAATGTSKRSRAALAHRILLRGLPNYLTPLGPYHPCLEELRHHPFLEDARKHMDDALDTETAKEIDRLSDEIVTTANLVRQETFMRYLAPAHEYRTIAVSGLKEAGGMLIPGVGFLSDMVEARQQEADRARLRWAGFVTTASDAAWAKARAA